MIEQKFRKGPCKFEVIGECGIDIPQFEKLYGPFFNCRYPQCGYFEPREEIVPKYAKVQCTCGKTVALLQGAEIKCPWCRVYNIRRTK